MAHKNSKCNAWVLFAFIYFKCYVSAFFHHRARIKSTNIGWITLRAPSMVLSILKLKMTSIHFEIASIELTAIEHFHNLSFDIKISNIHVLDKWLDCDATHCACDCQWASTPHEFISTEMIVLCCSPFYVYFLFGSGTHVGCCGRSTGFMSNFLINNPSKKAIPMRHLR